jgi:hypothetical protein
VFENISYNGISIVLDQRLLSAFTVINQDKSRVALYSPVYIFVTSAL